ncbi:hypothetical protein TIFTF001_038965 [Ficus carica]|uniref:Retrotransposon Copia-like N-terminal domain-containing protein n=1 Tax=Ficus carica TaxID=3494 RepID=A0AA88JDK8_FICCA|nr:hypothetical protein TIFTF001_038965 [Ficus carica]
MSSPLSVIFTQNKLTGENYNDWKRILLIVLNFEKHSFVLTQPRPPTPTIDAPDRDFVALERWDNSNLSAMCYIRASMSNVLQKQHKEHQTARQIMDNLEEMFGEQTIEAKTDAIKGLMNCRQKVGTPIKEHMMKVMAYLSEAQTNGAEIDSATQLVMVFQTLSKDFDLFQASYNLNRKEMSLTELMKELQAFENIFKGSGTKAEVELVLAFANNKSLRLQNFSLVPMCWPALHVLNCQASLARMLAHQSYKLDGVDSSRLGQEVLLPQVAGHGVALAKHDLAMCARLVHVLVPCGGRPWCLGVQALACQGTRLGGWLIQATSMRCLSLMWPVLVKPSETRLLIEP